MTDAPKVFLRYGTQMIEYRVERTRRRLTVAVVVDPLEGVIVRAPEALDEDRLAAIVRRKAAWIVTRRRRMEDLLPAAMPREFVSGETFRYLGRQLRLRVETGSGRREVAVSLARGRLEVRLPASILKADRSNVIRKSLVGWYRRRAAAYLTERVAKWSARFRVPSPPLLIRESPKRWGSCDSAGRVRLNWRVVQLAPRLIDYVVAHELVHLQHRNHGTAFWSRLGEVLHDADARRAALRKAGVTASW